MRVIMTGGEVHSVPLRSSMPTATATASWTERITLCGEPTSAKRSTAVRAQVRTTPFLNPLRCYLPLWVVLRLSRPQDERLPFGSKDDSKHCFAFDTQLMER